VTSQGDDCIIIMRDFRPPPRSIRELRFSGLLRSE